MCGVTTVKVKVMNNLLRKDLGLNVYIVEEITPFKSVGMLNNRRQLIKLIVVNLIPGHNNEMDRDLIPVIIPK